MTPRQSVNPILTHAKCFSKPNASPDFCKEYPYNMLNVPLNHRLAQQGALEPAEDLLVAEHLMFVSRRISITAADFTL